MALRDQATRDMRSLSAWPSTVAGGGVAALALMFGPLFWVAWQVDPLYSANQNTKFLQAIADAGFGFLRDDWLAQTRDGLPAFTLLTRVIYETLGPNGFYLAALACSTLFLFCALLIYRGLARHHDAPRYGTLVFLAVLFVIAAVTDLHELLLFGFCEQYILGGYFQPASFGVFLLLSVLLFERGSFVAALLCNLLAAAMHPAYVAPAAVMSAGYLLYEALYARVGGGTPGIGRMAAGIVSLTVLAGISAALQLSFAPTDPVSHMQARAILTDFRIPHHTRPEMWLGVNAFIQFGVCALASLVLPEGRFRFLIRLGLASMVVFTLAAFLPHTETYRLIGPWRISATIVPMASISLCAMAVIHAYKAGHLRAERANALALWCLAVIVVATGIGAAFTARKFGRAEKPYMAYVRANLAPGQLYLTPGESSEFRLATGAPQYVTHKSHPYQDVEVLEWQRRLTAAMALYSKPQMDCPALQNLMLVSHVTHVLLTDRRTALNCEFAIKVFEKGASSIYRLSTEPATASVRK